MLEKIFSVQDMIRTGISLEVAIKLYQLRKEGKL